MLPFLQALRLLRGKEAHEATAAAAASARDSADRTARRRGDPALRPPLLGIARARRPDRGLRRRHERAARTDARGRQPDSGRRAVHADLRRSLGDRRRSAGSAPTAPRRRRCRSARLRAVSAAGAALRASRRGLARSCRPCRARRGHRGRGHLGVDQARLPARARRLRPLARWHGDTRHRLLPQHPRDGDRDQRGKRRGGRDRAASRGGRPVAGGRARRQPSLLRPGGAVRVALWPAIEEERRCRPTSCSRA
jgi:hypothetical protein